MNQRQAEQLAEMVKVEASELIAEHVAVERDRCANKAREFAAHYPEASDGRNTFIILAEWIEAGK